MRNFQQKRKLGNILHSKPVLVFLGALMIFFTWVIINFLGKMKETSHNRTIAENKLIELEQKKEQLTVGIEKLKTDEGKEESVREKFGLAKEGEGLIIIVDDKNQPEVKEAGEGGFFSFIKNLFK